MSCVYIKGGDRSVQDQDLLPQEQGLPSRGSCSFPILKGELEARAGLVFSVTKVGVVKVMLTTTISTDACEELSNCG